jgi:hypothetical protein
MDFSLSQKLLKMRSLSYFIINRMKRILFAAAVVFLLVQNAYADKVPGRIIRKKDTLNVTFRIPMINVMNELSGRPKFGKLAPDFEKLQYEVTYYDANGKKQTLQPYEAEEIQFQHDGEMVRMLLRPYPIEYPWHASIFLKLESGAYLKLFRFYLSSGTATGGLITVRPNDFLQKGDEPLFGAALLGSAKYSDKYFADCPALVEKLKDKDFRKSDTEVIVDFYNSNCARR